MAKLMAGDTAMKVTTEAVQVLADTAIRKTIRSSAYARCENYANLRRNAGNSASCHLPHANEIIGGAHYARETRSEIVCKR